VVCFSVVLMTETTVPPGVGVDHPVARAVVGAIAGLSGVAGSDGPGVWQLSGPDCLAVKVGVDRLSAMLAAVDLLVVGEIDAREVTSEVAGVNTVAWLRGECQQSLADARADVALARGLRGRFAGVAAGMAAGVVSKKQAQSIVSVLSELPEEMVAGEVVKAEEAMVEFAAEHDPVGLRRLAGHLLAVVAPEVAEAHEAKVLAGQEKEALRTQFLRWRDDGDGSLRFSGKVPAAVGEQFRAVVEALAKGQQPPTFSTATPTSTAPADPADAAETAETAAETAANETDVADEPWAGFGSRDTSSSQAGEAAADERADAADVDEPWAGFGSTGTSASDDPTDTAMDAPVDEEPWDRPEPMGGFIPPEPDPSVVEPCPSIEARRAQALMTLVLAYLAGGTGPKNGGDRPRVTVVVKYEDLLRGVGGATLLGSDTRISPAEARRLACDADILPAVLGSDSQLLDLGRSTRLFGGDLRQAIALRDRGCVFPGCHREPRHCDAHHLTPWTQGGQTSYDNAALVCPTHHRLVEPDPNADPGTEHQRWRMRMSNDGVPEVIPPSPNGEPREPQRHKRFRVRH